MLSVAVLVSLPLWYGEARDDGFWLGVSRLDFVGLPTADPQIDAIFDRREIPAAALTSFEAFGDYATRRYGAIAGILAHDWNVGPDAVREAAFFAGLTGTLFAYGNKERPEMVGCAGDNELRAAPAAGCLLAAEFLNSRIGCCDDYARLMKYLLDTARIPNRLVAIPSHTFNEIDIAGRRFVVDANTGLIFDRSWEELSTRPGQRIYVYTLPLAGLMDAASENYRPQLGRLRSNLVRIVARGGAPWEYQDRNAPCFPEPPGTPMISSRVLPGTKEP
jgi:hypothetical protein